MSHQPFESWILSEAPLSKQDQQALDHHLMDCQQCNRLLSALVQVTNTFTASPPPEPAPGFTQRWHTRLSIVRSQRQQRKMWGLTLGIFAIAGLSLTLMLLENINNINWAYEITQLIVSLSLLASRSRQIFNLLRLLINSFPLLLPIIVVTCLVIVSSMSALVITWLGTVINLYRPIHKGVNPR